MTSSHPSIYDVIVAGAGPVGLFLACELALRNCSVLVLERSAAPHSPLKQLPFGLRGLSAPSIEALHRRGLLDQLEVPRQFKNPFAGKAGAKGKKAAGHFAGMQFFQDDVDAMQWRYRLPDALPTILLSEMAELETLLARRAQALGVDIRRGRAVTGCRQDADSVTVASGDEAFTARWLVGCDGARSPVRKAAGFDFAGTEPEFTGYSVSVDLADPEQLPLGRHVTPTGMYFQSQPGHFGIQDFDGGAFHDAGQPATRAHVQAILRRVSGVDVTIATVHLATTWTDRARQATRYRKNRILLAGDAAHIHAPLGGQGLNLGLGDAMNLGWKLAATVHGGAPAGLLDTYEAERHPVGAQVLDWSRAQVALMRPGPAAQALRAIMRDLLATRDGATYVAGRVWGVRTRLDLGAGHPLIGCSVPEFPFEEETTIGTRMRAGQGLLLDLGSNPGLAQWVAEYADRIRYLKLAPSERIGVNAVLVRPDGIVAWAADGPPDIAELQATAGRWFAPARTAAL